jgi:lysosomal acid lipase/cholesteryl ester hydrolase
MFRIPGLKHEAYDYSSDTIKSPLYFQHGIADSADAFVMNTVDKSPAFIAASLGYDVWLGNCRGNKYSRQHDRLDPDDDA